MTETNQELIAATASRMVEDATVFEPAAADDAPSPHTEESSVAMLGRDGADADEEVGNRPVDEAAPVEPPTYFTLEYYNSRSGVELTLINVAAQSEEHARQIADERCAPEFRIVPAGARVGFGSKSVPPGEDSLRVKRQDGAEVLKTDFSFKGMAR